MPQNGKWYNTYKSCSPDVRNGFFDTDPNKCHLIMIFIVVVFFTEKEYYDAKMIVPTNHETY